MKDYDISKGLSIVYFSGTGGTRRIAYGLNERLKSFNINTSMHELDAKNKLAINSEHLLIILYPVYAFNAPRPVYDFISSLPMSNKAQAAVISVSGGGEVSPNRACRLHVIQRLKKRGYNTVYENMLVMPSNVFVKTPDELSLGLLGVLPSKLDKIVYDLISGSMRRTKPVIMDRLASYLGEGEKIGGLYLGKLIKADENCSGCGLCANNCPSGNIVMDNGRPHFEKKCLLCMRCLYSCPKQALNLTLFKFFKIEQGYNLAALEEDLNKSQSADIKEKALKAAAESPGFSALAEYIKDN